MDSGGWARVKDSTSRMNRYAFAHYRGRSVRINIETLVNDATDGVDQDKKLRWQFSVLLRR